MTEEEIITSEPEDYTPDPEPAPEPDPAPTPEPEPAPEPEPTPDPASEPEAPAAPVEVVTVEDLLSRLTGEESTEEPAQEAEGDVSAETEGELSPGEGMYEGPIEVIGMDTVLKRLETIQGTVDHSMMETPFDDYTVTEGLLLLLLLSVFAAVCVKMLRGGFAWLR